MPKLICCPYYKYERGGNIVCEGKVRRFRKGERRRAHIRRYCGSLEGWRGCPHAQAMERFYEALERAEKNGKTVEY